MRAHARQTEKKIPTWFCMSVPWRWRWGPVWRPDEVTTVRASDPHRVMTLGYQYVDETGKSYVVECALPVFHHEGLMDIHVLGKAGASAVPTAFRSLQGVIFSGYHMRAMPPQLKVFDCFPTEVMFGLPGNDVMVGSVWRNYRGNPAFESQIRRWGT